MITRRDLTWGLILLCIGYTMGSRCAKWSHQLKPTSHQHAIDEAVERVLEHPYGSAQYNAVQIRAGQELVELLDEGRYPDESRLTHLLETLDALLMWATPLAGSSRAYESLLPLGEAMSLIEDYGSFDDRAFYEGLIQLQQGRAMIQLGWYREAIPLTAASCLALSAPPPELEAAAQGLGALCFNQEAKAYAEMLSQERSSMNEGYIAQAALLRLEKSKSQVRMPVDLDVYMQTVATELHLQLLANEESEPHRALQVIRCLENVIGCVWRPGLGIEETAVDYNDFSDMPKAHKVSVLAEFYWLMGNYVAERQRRVYAIERFAQLFIISRESVCEDRRGRLRTHMLYRSSQTTPGLNEAVRAALNCEGEGVGSLPAQAFSSAAKQWAQREDVEGLW